MREGGRGGGAAVLQSSSWSEDSAVAQARASAAQPRHGHAAIAPCCASAPMRVEMRLPSQVCRGCSCAFNA